MAKYTLLQFGSSGAEVKKLQQALNQAGASLETDGIFGKKTENAVKNYQKKNGLVQDGIAGDKTLGKLYGSAQKPATQAAVQKKPATQTQTVKPYTPGPEVQAAYEALQALEKPTQQPFTWQQELEQTLEQILQRQPFTYDVNTDLLYQQYAQLYKEQGRLAMEDSMAQAAALTGGYGNTYAQQAGQQAYAGYMQKLAEKLPEFYGAAADRYNAAGSALQDRFGLLYQQQQAEYDRYQDALAEYYQQYSQAAKDYNDRLTYDREVYESDRNYAYQQEKDRQEAAYRAQQDALEQQRWEKEYALAASKSSGGSSGSGSSSKRVLNYKAMGYEDVNHMLYELRYLARTKGNTALQNKLFNEYQKYGYLDSETAYELYLDCVAPDINEIFQQIAVRGGELVNTYIKQPYNAFKDALFGTDKKG